MEKTLITKDDLERVAGIARLKPTGEELEWLQRDANAILEYFSLIEEIPKSAGAKARQYVLDHGNAGRPDEAKPTGPAPIRRGFAREQDGYLQAPRSL
jgi:Asp-tRNA(Asn)/Glu-tRNA(Gln) amidotransferase C subunit